MVMGEGYKVEVENERLWRKNDEEVQFVTWSLMNSDELDEK